MKPACLLILALACSVSVNAQSKLTKASITRKDGTTLSGFIEKLTGDKNPSEVIFHENEGSPPVVCRANDIEQVSTEDELYMGAVVEVDNSPIKINSLETNPEMDLRKDVVFLQVLALGSKSLYYYKDHNAREHFFIDRDGTPELLVFHRYLRYEEAGSRVMEIKTYLGQLRLYLGDCPVLNNSLYNLKYTKSELISLFKKYYKCMGEEPTHLRGK